MVLVGQQGAGKTTFYRERYAATHRLLSKDLMGGTDKDLRILKEIEKTAKAGQSVVIDNTNPTPAHRMRWVAAAEDLGMVPIAVWFDIPTAVCKYRVATRNPGVSKSRRVDPIGFEVVRKNLSKPELDEGFVQIVTITTADQVPGKEKRTVSTNFNPDDMGSRLKYYEGLSDVWLMPKLPVVVRLDGRAFHSFTSDMRRPYDEDFTRCMVATTRFLLEETNALIGYTQSDEISLILYSPDTKSQIYFDGRKLKIETSLAALATLIFNEQLALRSWDLDSPEQEERIRVLRARRPTFDCRAFNVPTVDEAANAILWREQDATRNSISMAAQSKFSPTQLHKKNAVEMQDMLHSVGINWNDYPAFFRRGTYLQKKRVVRKFTCAEIDKLPAKHEARTNPNLMVERWDFQEVQMPPFGKVSNRVGVIFNGEAPQPTTHEISQAELAKLLETGIARKAPGEPELQVAEGPAKA